MRVLLAAICCFSLVILTAPAATADLISVAQVGPSTGSGGGGSAAIIGAPSDALDDMVTNTAMQGFNEAQGVVTSVAHAIDGGGSIAAGTLVDSHMIFLNTASGSGLHHSVTWTFDGVILGVMSDSGGTLEAASTFELGAAGTNYTVGAASQVPPFPARGLEGNNGTGTGASDGYLVSGSSITVSMYVTEPGDWIRVITASAVPEPGTWALLALGLVGVIGMSVRRRRRATA